MFVIYGKRTARIRKYVNHQQSCINCRSFNHEINVYRDYFHLYFIPVFALGEKRAEIKCKDCGVPFFSSEIQDEYQKKSRTPIYLYTILILFVGLVIFLINANLNTQKEKALFIANPAVGDVYRIRIDSNNTTRYFFLRIANITSDTVTAYHSNLEYSKFITQLHKEDFFVKDDVLYFTKQDLKQMLERMEINSVERGYDDEEGFNRIK